MNLTELESAVGKMTPRPWSYSEQDGEIGCDDGGTNEDVVGIVALRNAAPELIAAARERDELRTESAKHRTALKSLESLHEQTMIVASASNTQKAQEIAALKARKVTLPLLRHIKSRAVSDYTYSEHAEVWDGDTARVMLEMKQAEAKEVQP